jgi:NAD(P)-dependent dehydrogenase (short-subunit alcohol dehydrogenase family)
MQAAIPIYGEISKLKAKLRIADTRVDVNYGLNRVRFPAPVAVGSRIRAAGRPGRPEEVTAGIALLASEDASYVTGQALPVDEGNIASLNLPGMKV